MNTRRRLPALVLIAALASIASSEAGPVAEWDPAAARATGGKTAVPDTVSGMTFEGGPETDSSIEQSSAFPDGAAVVFGGQQTKSMRTIAGRSVQIGSGTGLELSFLPEAGTEDMTLFTSPGLELRYLGSKERLDIIVYYDVEEQKGNYVSLNLEAKTGEWNKVKVSISDTEVTGELNGMTERKQLLNPVKSIPAALQLGMKNDGRPFRGKVGKIVLTQD